MKRKPTKQPNPKPIPACSWRKCDNKLKPETKLIHSFCPRHYSIISKMVKSGSTTWEALEAAGVARKSQRDASEFRKFILGKTEEGKKAMGA